MIQGVSEGFGGIIGGWLHKLSDEFHRAFKRGSVAFQGVSNMLYKRAFIFCMTEFSHIRAVYTFVEHVEQE